MSINEEFIQHVKNNNTEMVTKLLTCGIKIKVRGKNNKALSLAAKNNNEEIVDVLLKHGANVHSDDDGALVWAVHNNNVRMDTVLLERGANMHARNDQAISTSIARGYIEMVIKLLEYGTNTCNYCDEAFRLAVTYDYKEIVSALLQYNLRKSIEKNYVDDALQIAAKYGHTKMIEILLEYGYDINVDDGKPLRLSVAYSNPEVIGTLLGHGANVYCCDKEILKNLQKYFSEQKADVIFEYCNADDHHYFPVSYVKNKVVPTKSARNI